VGQRFARESDDRGLGGDVAPDADIPLRLVALASTGPDLRKIEPHAGGSCPEKGELSIRMRVVASSRSSQDK
jgi:hypothetical protein